MLYFEGQPFTIIGWDGGLQEHPVTTQTSLVAPGERLDVIVAPRGKSGSQKVLLSALYNRGLRERGIPVSRASADGRVQ
jgi:FtsP/CotA-like multicopper oxidase with cupredoxin domain